MADEKTDLSRWRLTTEHGRHVWTYLSEAESRARPQPAEVKYHLNTLTSADIPHTAAAATTAECIAKSAKFIAATQSTDGHWSCDYGGPMFLTPGLMCSLYVTGSVDVLPEAFKIEMRRYLFNLIGPEGGWGLHIEDNATMFGTVMNYVAMRILGVPADEPRLARARALIKKNGGALYCPAWAKFWLSAMNLHSWDGLMPVQPELWLLPTALPFHPSRYWCHTRMVYLPMGYMYGTRFQAPVDDFIRALRSEIYVGPYEDIVWYKTRDLIADTDNYSPKSALLTWGTSVLAAYEYVAPVSLRQRALDEVVRLVQAEDTATHCIGIGPVSKVMNLVIAFHRGGRDSQWFRDHIDRVKDYLWMGPEGMRMTGTNGTQLWDAAFMVQAVLEAGLGTDKSFRGALVGALRFLDETQVRANVVDHARAYRDASSGGYPFSTRDCGWIVSDCTAEGLKGAMMLQELPGMEARFRAEHHERSVDVLLAMQNDDGGYGSYESRRAPAALEVLNPAQVFGDIMVEYSYCECTSSVVQGLFAFTKRFPDYRKADILSTLSRAYSFIVKDQRADGSWYGSWGVCFTYAIMFGLEALSLYGETYATSDRARRACDFLISKQQADGGWGESYLSSTTKEYHQCGRSQVVNTAWSVLALTSVGYPDVGKVRAGVDLIRSRQRADGGWDQENIMGNFNKSCMISYPNYVNIFTLWALGRFRRVHELGGKLH